MRFWVKALAGFGLAMASMETAQAAWWQAQTQHFTVYSEGRDETLRGFAERLEKFDFLLRRLTGVDSPEKGSPVKVYLLSSEAKVQKLARNSRIAGFYTTSDRNAFAVLSREKKVSKFDFGAEEVLFHEYAHHFMLHHFPAAYPAWYVEGFAEFFSVVKFPQDGAIEYGHIPLARLPGMKLGTPYPVQNLFARDANGLSIRDGDRYYGTAWLLTHLYQYDKTGRREEIKRYLNDLATGVPNVQPDTYFAGGLAGLEKALNAYIRRSSLPYNKLTVKEMNIGTVSVTPIDGAQAELVEDELSLINHPRLTLYRA